MPERKCGNCHKLKNLVDSLCLSVHECQSCNGLDCISYFSRQVVKLCKKDKKIIFPFGLNIIPKTDIKKYNTNNLIEALSFVLVSCHGCNHEHNDKCLLNVLRVSLNWALLKKDDDVPYRGIPSLYIMQVIKNDPSIGGKLMARFNEMRKEVE